MLWRANVVRRNWWDYFRVTHGVLAATQRRLLYVGVPPEELLPREPEPLELEVLSFPYEQGVSISRERVFFGTLGGIVLRGAGPGIAFGVASHARDDVDSVLAALDRRLLVLREAQASERRATEATIAAARRPTYHLVQRGDALVLIAQRYGTPVESLRVWNNLPSNRIVAGMRLMVRRGR